MSAVFPTAVSPTVTTVTSGALATLPLSLPAIQLPDNSVNSPSGFSHFSVNSWPSCHQLSQEEGSPPAGQAAKLSPSSPRGFSRTRSRQHIIGESLARGALEREIEERPLPLPPSQQAPVDCTSPRCPEPGQPDSSLPSLVHLASVLSTPSSPL